MEKIELPISKNYVRNWTIYDALREIFQNAIDRERDGPVFAWDHDYDEDLQELKIRSKNSKLTVKSLLLGNSEKSENDKMIGQFGEGYKLALIVLLRNKCPVVIFNDQDVWSPCLEYSEKFETDILTIHIDQNMSEKESLIFKIGLKPQMWKAYHRFNLYIQNKYERLETDYGDLLLDERHKRKLFVGGLYICDLPKDFEYGYNFNPGEIPLNRDRKQVNGFDVSWQCRKMGEEFLKHKDVDVVKMLKESKADTAFLYNHSDKETKQKIADRAGNDFIQEHGAFSVPVSSEGERIEALDKYAGVATVFVKNQYKEAVINSEQYKKNLEKMPERPPIKTPHERVMEFVNDYSIIFENKTDFTRAFTERIFDESKNWMIKI